MLESGDLGHRVVVRHHTEAGPTDVLGELTGLDDEWLAVRTEAGEERRIARTDVIAAKPVEIGPEVDGLRIIRSGLTPTDHVVITGYQFARPGTKAVTKTGKIAVTAPKKAAESTEPVSAQATFAR